MNVRFLLLQLNTFSIVVLLQFNIQNNAFENVQVEYFEVDQWRWMSKPGEIATGAFVLANVRSLTGYKKIMTVYLL